MEAAARFGENPIEQRAAAGAEECGFDERILLLKAVDDFLALIQGHRGVENHLALFFCALDHFRVRRGLSAGVVKDRKEKNQRAGQENAMFLCHLFSACNLEEIFF